MLLMEVLIIITRTPYRISFFGGGTDYPVYYREHGGEVLSTTIDKYCHIVCRYLPPFFSHKYLVRYSQKETPNSIEDILHPSVRECLRFVGIKSGIEMVHTGDIPAQSGIGSSSAFTVGLLNALYALKGKLVTKRELAMNAIHVEQNLIGEQVGSQDQMAAAFGGFNRIVFDPSGNIVVYPITVSNDVIEILQESLLFYFTGISRIGPEIARAQIEQTPRRIAELSAMRSMVQQALEILNGRPEHLMDFGKLMHESWMIKRSLTERISSYCIDDVYQTALQAGALGGKLCGAGGGGFILFVVPPENKTRVKEKLSKMMQVTFRFEIVGSHVIHYSRSHEGE